MEHGILYHIFRISDHISFAFRGPKVLILLLIIWHKLSIGLESGKFQANQEEKCCGLPKMKRLRLIDDKEHCHVEK